MLMRNPGESFISPNWEESWRSEFFVSSEWRLLSLHMEETQEPSADLVYPESVKNSVLKIAGHGGCDETSLGTWACTSTAVWVPKEHVFEAQLHFPLSGLLSVEKGSSRAVVILLLSLTLGTHIAEALFGKETSFETFPELQILQSSWCLPRHMHF